MGTVLHCALMTTLNSSAIAAAGYDPLTRVLRIRFTSGYSYSYRSVPERIFLGLIHSTSPGTYYNLHIRGIYR
jgi:hypothetical protein